jgi:hypothetical protein
MKNRIILSFGFLLMCSTLSFAQQTDNLTFTKARDTTNNQGVALMTMGWTQIANEDAFRFHLIGGAVNGWGGCFSFAISDQNNKFDDYTNYGYCYIQLGMSRISGFKISDRFSLIVPISAGFGLAYRSFIDTEDPQADTRNPDSHKAYLFLEPQMMLQYHYGNYLTYGITAGYNLTSRSESKNLGKRAAENFSVGFSVGFLF